MGVLTRPAHEAPDARPRRRTGAIAGLVALGVLVVLALAVAAIGLWGDTSTARSVTQTRTVAPFHRVELAGTNMLVVRVGAPQSVRVTAGERIVDRVTTTVRDGTLVVADRGSFTSTRSMRVTIAVPTLDAVTLSDTGTVTVEGVRAETFTAVLSGTGTLEVSGTADRVDASLGDTGTLDLSRLVARDAVARLDGTGTIMVHATSTLDATLAGTGSILYAGNPTVTSRTTGTGTITPE